MKSFPCILLLAMAFCSACTTHSSDPLQARERITYYDRNGDGKVDREIHHHPGVVDADWELRDDNYDGRYKKKILYGVVVREWNVNIPVPTNVKITKEAP